MMPHHRNMVRKSSANAAQIVTGIHNHSGGAIK
jgi:hypothetical protein